MASATAPWLLVLSAALAIWIVGLSVWIVFERRSPLATLAWILALGALPVVGIPIYFFVGPRRFDRKKRRRDAAQCAAARATWAAEPPSLARQW